MIRLIAGSGRSGTTWIQDALATANRLRPVFEPLHSYASEAGNRYAHKAISADEDQPELREFLIDVCAGRGPRLWTQYRQQARWLFPPPSQFWTRQDAGRCWRYWAKFLREFPRMTLSGWRVDPLVKCIRANLMLPWIARHLDCRIVLVVRHPGAVIESELRSGWNPSFALERFRNDSRLHELTNGRYVSLLARTLSHVEALATRWVIENQWVTESATASGITVVHYEKLRSSGGSEWARLCSALDLPTVPKIDLLTRPSQQSGAGRISIPLEQSKTPRWMSALTAEETDQVRGILDAVEFDTYVLHEPLPRDSTHVGVQSGFSVAIR
jgi:hypothetical protein